MNILPHHLIHSHVAMRSERAMRSLSGCEKSVRVDIEMVASRAWSI